MIRPELLCVPQAALDYITELEAENKELKLGIIAATGQAQTALEENAALREAAKEVVLYVYDEFHQEELEALQAALEDDDG